ncbi:hypothetical protein Trydic_g14374 [Trypoxylus dichotomus]
MRCHTVLSFPDFINDISRDGAKKCIVPGKWLLQSLLVWPDNESRYITALNWILFANLMLLELFHASYVVVYRTEYGNAITAAATVTTTFECLVRYYIIVFKKPVINEILVSIWKKFWPLSVVSARKTNRLKNKCYITLALTFGCYGPALVCNTIFTLTPYLTDSGLVFKSVFPFSWNQTYVYEALYFWQYVTAWYILILVNSFDFFMIPLVMICAVQFALVRNAFKNILNAKSERQRQILYGEAISDREMFLKCLDQQRMLIGICKQLEEVFRVAILFQFFCSTAALCTSIIILQVDETKFILMLTFAIAHMFQLFYYCYVGNELTVESDKMADAVYASDWYLSHDIKFKKELIFVLQRCQKPQTLTAAGFIDLNFLSYISVLRVCFSFYTLLTKLIVTNNSKP